MVSVRILTNKDTGKSKGFAFVEFSDNESYHKGLDCHQSLLKNRRINVEMTAGGGGSSSEARKGKIKKKNEVSNKVQVYYVHHFISYSSHISYSSVAGQDEN